MTEEERQHCFAAAAAAARKDGQGKTHRRPQDNMRGFSTSQNFSSAACSRMRPATICAITTSP
jgi:hypothetical protein